MKLKKIIIACVAGAAILATPIIPSKVSNAYPACYICGGRLYPGQNHTHENTVKKRIVRTCDDCGHHVYPGETHKCVYY
ncbi:hypothetical protein [Clostridium sp.]|uniref:hypothetical protein n=1 Tax=Clostridium sp. TaxID=1506 RepID=UPI003464CB94